MVIYPDFRLFAGSNDITVHIKSNLISLSLDDRDGLESDELTFTVAGIYVRPLLGDKLTLLLGTVGNLNDYGDFSVHSTSIDHMAETTEIRAAAVDFSSSTKERKSQLWEALTIADITKQVAIKNELSFVAQEAEGVLIESRAQNDTSDLVFLRTLANEYGFTCIVKNNTIYITPKGEVPKETAISDISKNECMSLQINRAAKKEYKAVRLEWRDQDTAQVMQVVAGSSYPVYNIRDIIPKNPAEAKLKELRQGTVSGSLTIPGGKHIKAGCILELAEAGEDSGTYTINGVTHSMGTNEYTINVEYSAE